MRPFHFTTDSSSLFDEEQDGTDATWTVDTGNSIVSVTGGSADTRWIRKTDTANTSTVEIRAKSAAAAPFGALCNWQSGTQFYLAYLRSGGNITLFIKNGGYTSLAATAYATSNGTYYRVKITATTNGSNKDLAAFVDGVSQITASTATVYGAGRAGIMPNAAGGQVDIDWFAFNTTPAITSIAPDGGPSATATSLTITGTDFGDGSVVTVGGTAATSVVATPNTSIACDTPTDQSTTRSNVVVSFGTAGSEEYASTAFNGFVFGGGFAGEGFNGVV